MFQRQGYELQRAQQAARARAPRRGVLDGAVPLRHGAGHRHVHQQGLPPPHQDRADGVKTLDQFRVHCPLSFIEICGFNNVHKKSLMTTFIAGKCFTSSYGTEASFF